MQSFLENLFKGKPVDQYVTLYELPKKKSYWFKKVSDMEDKAEELNLEEPTPNIFYSIGTSTQRLSTNERIKSHQVTGIGCIHADIDFGKKGHKRENLPPNIKEAMKMATCIAIPTYLISSGNGFHALFLFKEFLTKKEDIKRAWDLQKLLQITINAYSKYDLDMTHDLARVLRVPGSFNMKESGNPKPCHVQHDNSHIRYTLDEIAVAIDEFTKNKTIVQKDSNISQKSLFDTSHIDKSIVPDEDIAGSNIFYNQTYSEDKKYKIINDRLIIDPRRNIDPNRFYELEELFDHKFENIYKHKKILSDNTASGYDMALANMAAEMDWDEQDICDLLLSHRKYHKEDLKLGHSTYYGRTIYKAYEWTISKNPASQQWGAFQKAQANSEPSESGEEQAEDKVEKEKEKARDLMRNSIESTLGVKIHQILQYKQDPEHLYEVQLDPSLNIPDIHIGNFNRLQQKNVFINKISEALISDINAYMSITTELSKQQWANIKKYMVPLILSIDIDDSATFLSQTAIMIKDYMDNHIVCKNLDEYDPDIAQAIELDGYYYFEALKVYKAIKEKHDKVYTLPIYKICLMKLGSKPVDFQLPNGKTKSLWKLEKKKISDE